MPFSSNAPLLSVVVVIVEDCVLIFMFALATAFEESSITFPFRLPVRGFKEISGIFVEAAATTLIVLVTVLWFESVKLIT